jgi:ribonuclease PH
MLRAVEIERNYITSAPGSVLYRCGETVVLCTASFEDKVPDWMAGKGKGWVTAEYNMLPGSTPTRKRRDRSGKVDGRTTEIQRLIGRSLRAVVDMRAMGEQSLFVDCDVLKADGGTRTAAITGGFVAMFDALRTLFPDLKIGSGPILDSVAAISVGIVDGKLELDLDYKLDVNADVDMNVVMTGNGDFVEVQGTGEKSTFNEDQLSELIKLARQGIQQLTTFQRDALELS